MRVFVGMSGGVDSSVAAALLAEQGHDVTGVYMKNWTEDLPGMKCPWAEDLADAKRVAVQLGISLKVYDFQKQYKQRVVDYMLDEYTAGRTPNPDIMCNQEVKFKLFLETALDDGADMIATGHYADIQHDDTLQTGRLFMARDDQKDQTYFLARVRGSALYRTLFPLGRMTKPEVRKEAQKRGLATSVKKDSQGICFVGSVGIKEFLSQYIETKPGDIVDQTTGKIVGKHDGAIYYTIGQRHGMQLGGGLPYYVVRKDMAKNLLYVSRDLNDISMWRTNARLRDIHWINKPAAHGKELYVRLRHRGQLLPCRLDGDELHLTGAERAVVAGQSAVFYCSKECLGSGIIAD